MSNLRIMIVEDNKAVRQGLRTLLESRDEWQVVGEAAGGREAVEKATQLRPDMVILDYSLPELDGLSAASLIHKEVPQAELMVLSQHDAPYTVRRALDLGVRGYVVKSDAGHDLMAAVEAVCRHEVFVSSSVAESAKSHKPAPDKGPQ